MAPHVRPLEEEMKTTHLVTQMTPDFEASGKYVPHLESFSDGFEEIGDN